MRDLQDSLDALFRAPLEEFTALRNRLAAEHKAAGEKAAAATLKAVRKPVVTAWAVNVAVLNHAEGLASLQRAGDALRRAQMENASAPELQEAMGERRRWVEHMVARACEVLRRGGVKVSPAHLERVQKSVEAIAAFGTTPPEPVPGRWTHDMDPPGFEVLAGMPLLARPERAVEEASDPPVLKKSAAQVAREALAEAKARLREAELAWESAREDAEASEQRAKELALAALQEQERAASKREKAEQLGETVIRLRQDLERLSEG